MTRFELSDMVIVQIEMAGFKRWSASSTSFERAVEAGGCKFRLRASLDQKFSISREFEHMEVVVVASVANKFWGESCQIACERVELRAGDTIDRTFFPSLLQKVLEESADVLGKMATAAAAGAMTGSI